MLASGHTRIDTDVTSIDGVEDTVLEAGWVLDVEIDLAVFAALGDCNTGSDRGDEVVEDESEAVKSWLVKGFDMGRWSMNVCLSSEMKVPSEP